MVMIFAVKEARDQLLNQGIVYTFRKTMHREGKDWATDQRCGRKIADIKVKLILSQVRSYMDLRFYLYQSGFSGLDEWWRKITELYGESSSGYLYKVTLLSHHP